VRQFAQALRLESPYVVGHDIGGTVAHALGRLYPAELRGVMIIESPLPGLPPWNEIAGDVRAWHINFHQTEKTPEILISGWEAAYFRSHFFEVGLADKAAVNEAKLRRYAAA
jgi:pimeloyl-ACP methyl ester carboxylesterase